MSQEKVNRYKEEKANRKKAMARQKRMNLIRKTVVSVVCMLVVGWIGYSAYGTYVDNQPRESVQVDYSAITEYLQDYKIVKLADGDSAANLIGDFPGLLTGKAGDVLEYE